jgi:hypothetical protein
VIAACCLLAAPHKASAGPNQAALLAAVKQLASQGQDAQTTSKVNQYVDQNQDAITAILNGYVNYLKQIQAMTADDGSGTAAQPAAAPAGGGAGTPPNAAPPNTANGTANGAANGGGQPSEVQPSAALGTSSVQPSGELRTSHLAGYPSLPDVDPVSSVTAMTAAQMEYSARVQKDMMERKQYLMQHPEGYTY